VCDVVSRSIRGKTLMYEIRRTGRKDKDNTWEPLNFLQNMAPYVMKMVKRFDEVMKAQEGGAAIRPLTTVEIRKHLADFQLDGQLADSRIKGFSGGQKSRLVLAAALWNRPHILALDEPTNYLDQEALGALASSITSFQGGVLMVSHNKEFVSQVSSRLRD
jgi:ATPase subunit of ABC transporter with duplicated ATPase domains